MATPASLRLCIQMPHQIEVKDVPENDLNPVLQVMFIQHHWQVDDFRVPVMSLLLVHHRRESQDYQVAE